MAGYIGNIPTPQATQSRQSFTATASQTTFATIGYTPNYVDVYLNGVHLLDGTDYTATNSSDVVLTVGAAVSDVIEVISYETFAVLDQTFTGTTTADILTTTGAFTSLGIDDNATSTAITIDASENVGIGTASPTQKLDITTAGTTRAFIRNTNLTSSGMYIGEDGTGQQILGVGAYPMRFSTNGSEAMRIDSSGNLLVGKTVADSGATAGVEITQTSTIYTNHTSASLNLNRTGTDGNVANFKKDGAVVGSIGASGGDLYVGTGDTTLKFSDAADVIVPTGSSGAARSGFLSLGNGSNKFKDLYLSGGVFLGGTGSANKLDDYEEGTWTATSGSAGSLTVSGGAYYTKVGNTVTLHLNSASFSDITSTLGLKINGLPFAGGASAAIGSTLIRYRDDDVALVCYIGAGQSQIKFYKSSTTANFVDLTHAVFNNTSNSMYLSITYQTT